MATGWFKNLDWKGSDGKNIRHQMASKGMKVPPMSHTVRSSFFSQAGDELKDLAGSVKHKFEDASHALKEKIDDAIEAKRLAIEQAEQDRQFLEENERIARAMTPEPQVIVREVPVQPQPLYEEPIQSTQGQECYCDKEEVPNAWWDTYPKGQDPFFDHNIFDY